MGVLANRASRYPLDGHLGLSPLRARHNAVSILDTVRYIELSTKSFAMYSDEATFLPHLGVPRAFALSCGGIYAIFGESESEAGTREAPPGSD